VLVRMVLCPIEFTVLPEITMEEFVFGRTVMVSMLLKTVEGLAQAALLVNSARTCALFVSKVVFNDLVLPPTTRLLINHLKLGEAPSFITLEPNNVEAPLHTLFNAVAIEIFGTGILITVSRLLFISDTVPQVVVYLAVTDITEPVVNPGDVNTCVFTPVSIPFTFHIY